jgi:RIO-like serine/threonine protein kinase
MGCAASLLKTDPDLETLYTLDKCIGEGVEGLVYLATCKASGAKVAIKLVPRWVQQHNRAARHLKVDVMRRLWAWTVVTVTLQQQWQQ